MHGCVCVCTPPVVLPLLSGAVHTSVSVNFAVTSTTRQCEWHGVLVINRFVIVMSCDSDRIIEANNFDGATSDVATRTRGKILERQHALSQASSPTEESSNVLPPRKNRKDDISPLGYPDAAILSQP